MLIGIKIDRWGLGEVETRLDDNGNMVGSCWIHNEKLTIYHDPKARQSNTRVLVEIGSLKPVQVELENGMGKARIAVPYSRPIQIQLTTKS